MTTPAVKAPYHEGYMEKQSPKGFLGAATKTKMWQKRWFVLQNTELSYFKKPSDTVPLGTIPLASVEQLLFDGKKFVFCLGERTFKLRPLDSKECQEWREALDGTMLLLKQGLGDEILMRLPDCKDGKWWKTFRPGRSNSIAFPNESGLDNGGNNNSNNGGLNSTNSSSGGTNSARTLSVVDEDKPVERNSITNSNGNGNGNNNNNGSGGPGTPNAEYSGSSSCHSQASTALGGSPSASRLKSMARRRSLSNASLRSEATSDDVSVAVLDHLDDSAMGALATEDSWDDDDESSCEEDYNLDDEEDVGKLREGESESGAAAAALSPSGPSWGKKGGLADANGGSNGGEAAAKDLYMEGYLKKQFLMKTPVRSTFVSHKRWFVLVGSRLYHYRNHQSDHKRGGGIFLKDLSHISMDSRKKMILLIQSAPAATSTSSSSATTSSSAAAAESSSSAVAGGGRELRLVAETTADAVKWMRAIAAAHHRAGGSLKFDFIDPSLSVSAESIVTDFDGCNEDLRIRQVDAVVSLCLKDALSLPDVLRNCDKLVMTLLSVCEIAARRLPPREDVARFVIREWNQRIFDAIAPYLKVDTLGQRKNEHLLVPWVTWYEDQLSTIHVGRLFVESCLKKSSSLSHLEGYRLLEKNWPTREDYVVMDAHKRRIKLRNGVIYFFKTHDNTTWKTCVRLSQVRDISKPSSKPRCIVITDGVGTRYKFKCESEDAVVDWFGILQSCIKPVVADTSDQRPTVEKPKPTVCEAIQRFSSSTKEELEDWMQKRMLAVFTNQGVSLADMDEILLGADQFLDELVEICEDLKKSTPYRQDIFDYYSRAYTTRMHDVMANFLKSDGPGSTDWTPGMTLRLITWVEKHKQVLEHHSIRVIPGKRIEELPEISECLLEYISNTSEQLRTRLDNIIAADMSSEAVEGADGTLQTPAPVDMFQMLNAQIELVLPTASQQMILQTIKNCLPMLLHFQQSLLTNFEEKNSEIPYTCAVANNCTTSLRFLESLQENVQQVLKPELCAQIDFESVEVGFHEVMNNASSSLATMIFASLSPLIEQIYEKNWFENGPGGSNVSTPANPNPHAIDPVGELIGDTTQHYKSLGQYLDPRLFRKVSREISFQLAFSMIERTLVGKKAKKIDDSFAHRASSELNRVASFLALQHRDHSVRIRIKMMKAIAELLTCVADDVTTHWTVLVACADASPLVAEKIFSLRLDLEKNAKADVLAKCQNVSNTPTLSRFSSASPILSPRDEDGGGGEGGEGRERTLSGNEDAGRLSIVSPRDDAMSKEKLVFFHNMQNESGFAFRPEEVARLDKKPSFLLSRLRLDTPTSTPPMSPRVSEAGGGGGGAAAAEGGGEKTIKNNVLTRVKSTRERLGSFSLLGGSKPPLTESEK